MRLSKLIYQHCCFESNIIIIKTEFTCLLNSAYKNTTTNLFDL